VSSEGDDRGEKRACWRDAGEKRPLTSVSTRQQHIAEMAGKYAGSPLTTLSHHLDMLWLREAYGRVRRDSAPGVDGQTVADYGKNLEANLQSLLERAKSGSYRAPLVKRVHIPKSETETRPIGMPTVCANCTQDQRAFGMGRHHPSVSPAARPAIPYFEIKDLFGHTDADLGGRGMRYLFCAVGVDGSKCAQRH
jgi:hypothetical protein